MSYRINRKFHTQSSSMTNKMILMLPLLIIVVIGLVVAVNETSINDIIFGWHFWLAAIYSMLLGPYLFFYRYKVYIFMNSYFCIGNCLGMTFRKYRKEDIEKIEWRDRNQVWYRRHCFFNDLIVTFKDGRKIVFSFIMEDFSRFVYALEAWSGIQIPNKERELDGRGNECATGRIFQRRYIEGTWTPKDDEITISE